MIMKQLGAMLCSLELSEGAEAPYRGELENLSQFITKVISPDNLVALVGIREEFKLCIQL